MNKILTFSQEWRKKRQKMAEELIRKGETFFNRQELIGELNKRIKNMNRFNPLSKS